MAMTVEMVILALQSQEYTLSQSLVWESEPVQYG